MDDLLTKRDPIPPGPIAYLTGEYPKVSHTFIEREIAALRARGLVVLTCTMRRPPPATVVGPGQAEEARRTFCVSAAARRPAGLFAAHAAALARDPGRWLAALRLAWKTRPPGLKAALWQLFYFLEAAVLARHLRQAGVVHLHNHFGDSSGSVAMLTGVMTGIPFSVTLHGPAIFYEPRRWRLDEKIARARFFFCISHFARSQAMYFSDPVHWPKLRIVHCGVTPAAYGPGPRDPAAPRDAPPGPGRRPRAEAARPSPGRAGRQRPPAGQRPRAGAARRPRVSRRNARCAAWTSARGPRNTSPGCGRNG